MYLVGRFLQKCLQSKSDVITDLPVIWLVTIAKDFWQGIRIQNSASRMPRNWWIRVPTSRGAIRVTSNNHWALSILLSAAKTLRLQAGVGTGTKKYTLNSYCFFSLWLDPLPPLLRYPNISSFPWYETRFHVSSCDSLYRETCQTLTRAQWTNPQSQINLFFG